MRTIVVLLALLAVGLAGPAHAKPSRAASILTSSDLSINNKEAKAFVKGAGPLIYGLQTPSVLARDFLVSLRDKLQRAPTLAEFEQAGKSYRKFVASLKTQHAMSVRAYLTSQDYTPGNSEYAVSFLRIMGRDLGRPATRNSIRNTVQDKLRAAVHQLAVALESPLAKAAPKRAQKPKPKGDAKAKKAARKKATEARKRTRRARGPRRTSH